MIVVDTSAMIAAVAARPPLDELNRRLAGDGDLHAPHLIDIEILHVLRRLVATGAMTLDRGDEARADLDEMPIVRYPHEPLNDRIWELRNNLTAYDAAFVSLAELLGVPVVTCDGRLQRSSGHDATIELYPSP